jgi:hypothetical protein
LSSIAEDPVAKNNFEGQMADMTALFGSVIGDTMFADEDWWPETDPDLVLTSFSMPECGISAREFPAGDMANAFMFGRMHNIAPFEPEQFQQSNFFPRGGAFPLLLPALSTCHLAPCVISYVNSFHTNCMPSYAVSIIWLADKHLIRIFTFILKFALESFFAPTPACAHMYS